MQDLYKNIKEKRLELNMTQTDLAQKAGYADKSMIAKIEKGSIDLPLSKIALFADIFDTSLGELIGVEIVDGKKHADATIKRIATYAEKLNSLGKKEAEKRVEELTQIDRYSTFLPQAAHNDHETDPDEQDKMQIDLTILKRPKEDNE